MMSITTKKPKPGKTIFRGAFFRGQFSWRAIFEGGGGRISLREAIFWAVGNFPGRGGGYQGHFSGHPLTHLYFISN